MQMRDWFTAARIRFTAGLAIILYETVFVQIDRPWLLVIAAGLMGYSVPSRLDKFLNSGDEKK